MGKRIVGLDIGSEMLRAVEVERGHTARATVTRYHELAVPEGAVKNGEVLEQNTVAGAIRQLWSSGGFKAKQVVIGVGNPKVLVRELSVPRLSRKDIRAALPFQVQEILPVPVSEALLDFYPVSESMTDNGPEVHGLLVAAVKESVMSNVRAVALAGLTPVEVDLIPFAMNRVLVRGAESSGTVALIDVGSTTTNVIITLDGVPQFVRIIPAGGGDITKALTGRLNLSVEQAERGKRQLGLLPATAPEHDEAAQVILEITRDLLNSLRNTLSFYVNSRNAAPISRIILSGGGTKLQSFPGALAELTRIPVMHEDPFATLSVARDADRSSSADPRIDMSIALGLALGRAA